MTIEILEGEMVTDPPPTETLTRLQQHLARAEHTFAQEIVMTLQTCYWQFIRLRSDRIEWARLVEAAQACKAATYNVPFDNPGRMMGLIVRYVAHELERSRSQLWKYAAALIAIFDEGLPEHEVNHRISMLVVEPARKKAVPQLLMLAAPLTPDRVITSTAPIEPNTKMTQEGVPGAPGVGFEDPCHEWMSPPKLHCPPGRRWLYIDADAQDIDHILNHPGLLTIEIDVYQQDLHHWHRVKFERVVSSFSQTKLIAAA